VQNKIVTDRQMTDAVAVLEGSYTCSVRA